jgi:hypothetical protein
MQGSVLRGEKGNNLCRVEARITEAGQDGVHSVYNSWSVRWISWRKYNATEWLGNGPVDGRTGSIGPTQHKLKARGARTVAHANSACELDARKPSVSIRKTN